MKGLDRPSISIWARTKWFQIYHYATFLIMLVLFFSLFNLRLVCRSADLLTNTTLWSNLTNVYAIQLLIESAVILLAFIVLVHRALLVYGVLLNLKRIRKTDELLLSGGFSFGLEGAQGVGKTRTMVHAAFLQAENKSDKLLYRYYCDLALKKDIEKKATAGDYWGWKRMQARREAINYFYFNNPDKIPHVYANVDINWHGKKPHVLKAKHFTMEERLYESNVKLLTEADDLLPNTMRKKKNTEADEISANKVDQFVGLDRQYCDGTLISDTHANSDIFRSVRVCQNHTFYLTRSEFRFTPRFLKRRLQSIKNAIFETGDYFLTHENTLKNDEKQELLLELNTLVKSAIRTEKWMKKLSITRIYYIKVGGPEAFKEKVAEDFYVLANDTTYVYDDRNNQIDYPFTPKHPAEK
ncbi:MAG: hypothetical protein IJW64_01905 [Clostridia bacterium]|nr:hypothetical protein [Clostridia bacterium]